jgi:polysaccharide pyruvyl transferase WcaK-like protein
MSVLVYGFYNKANLGDDLFIDAYRELFPGINFKFVDNISIADLRDVSTVIFGGGSFVYAEPEISPGAVEMLKSMRLFYIGIGVEGAVNSTHQELMKRAKLIATRSEKAVERLKELNPNTILIPDIVHCLKGKVKLNVRQPKSLLVLPNFELVPKSSDPNWKHLAWEYFKSEFSQFLDVLIDRKYNLKFLPFCNNERQNDDWAATEVISKMKYCSSKYLIKTKPSNIEDLSATFSSFESVITQRYHGIILAEITNTPYLSIHHHDKLKEAFPANGAYLPYYGVSKQDLLNKFDNLPNKFELDKDINERFGILKDKVSLIQ